MKICLHLNISERLHWQYLFQHLFSRGRRDPSPSSLLIRCNTHTPWRTTSTIQTKGDHHYFFIRIESCTYPRSGPFCWQNPCYGCNSGIDLVVVLEYTFFQLCSNTEYISQVHKIQKKLCKPPCSRSNQIYTVFLYLKLHCSFA